jgi:maltooligosyltrehalose trehalohydrolase
MQATDLSRRLPIGAEVSKCGGVHFRVWAPRAHRVDVILETDASAVRLEPQADGYHGGLAEAAAVGMRYRFRQRGDPLRTGFWVSLRRGRERSVPTAT